MEQKSISFSGHELNYCLIRKKIKNINLRLKADGSITISVPNHLPISYVEDFIKSKWDWIMVKQEEIRKLNFDKKDSYITNGKSVFILGKEYIVCLKKSSNFFVRLELGKIFVFSNLEPSSKELTNAYLNWLKREAEILFEKLLDEEYEKVKMFGVIKPHFVVRNMRSQWGSCTVSKNKICLNLQLMKKSTDCIRQVILHELVHLVHPNHSKHFYALLTKLMPEWKQLKMELEQSYIDDI